MKKAAFFIMLLTILTKILGFAREITLAYFYGASGITDAYLISLTIPSTIFAFIGTGLAASYIPVYSSILSENGELTAFRFTNNLLSIIMIFCTLIVIIVVAFTSPIVKLFASGFSGETLELAILFTRIGIISIYFSGLIFVFNGFLQIREDFMPTVVSGVILNLVTIFAIVYSSSKNIIILSVGSAFAVLVQFIFLIPFINRNGFKYSLVFEIKNIYIRRMLFLSLPVIIGVSVNQINILVDRTIASQISVGGITALSYANRLNLFIQGVFVMSLVTVFYPMISKMSAENNMTSLKKLITEVVNIISLFVLPATLGAMLFADPIVTILFGRGAFDQNAISMTSVALFFYSMGMISFGLREILSRVFYSMQDTKTPMINAAIGMVLNIALNIILSKFMGIGGLALATSIAAFFTTTLMFASLRKKIGPFGMKHISISFLKILFASLIMGLTAKLSFNYLTTIIGQNFSLLVAIGIGAVVYFVIIYFMKIEDVDVIVNVIKEKI